VQTCTKSKTREEQRGAVAKGRPTFSEDIVKKFLAMVLFLAPVMSSAQTISPVHSEAKIDKKGHATGELTVRNDTLYREVVTVEPTSLYLDEDGKLVMGKMSPKVFVKLSDTSFVLPAKGSRTVYWTADTNEPMLHLMLISSFHTMLKTKEGMSVLINLGASAYACTDTVKDCRERVLTSEGLQDKIGEKIARQ
jgi:hypothetical protein